MHAGQATVTSKEHQIDRGSQTLLLHIISRISQTTAIIIEMADSTETTAKRARVPSSEHSDDEHDESRGTSIHAALSTLLHNEKYSDMTIICKGHEYKAHRAIVCTQSKFFDTAMSRGFKVYPRAYNGYFRP
jgi:hypothetical protein